MAKSKQKANTNILAFTPPIARDNRPVFRKHVIAAGRELKSAKDLLEFIDHIDGDRSAVQDALKIVTNSANLAIIEKAIGYRRDELFHLRVAMTVAAMNLDRSPESTHTQSSGKYTKLKALDKKSEQMRRHRVESVIAALLQEFVAYGAIRLKEVEAEFGKEVADLTRQLSRITRLPITIRPPDANGQMRLADFHFNEIQHELGQELIYRSDDPARVGLIKIAHALQELRSLHHVRDEVLRSHTALHIMGLYLPLVRETGIKDIQHEMQDLLIQNIDPQAAMDIDRWYKDIDAAGKCERISVALVRYLQNVSYGLDSIVSIEVRKKETFSVWAKQRYKMREKIEQDYAVRQQQVKEEFAERRKQFEKSNIVADENSTVHLAAMDAELIARQNELKVEYDNQLVPVTRLIFKPALFNDALGTKMVLKDRLDEDGKPKLSDNHHSVKALNRKLTVGPRDESISPIFQVVPGREKDYYKKPKKNGYKSFQNTYEFEGQRFEFQIVVESDNRNNGDGMARHASHKDALVKDKIRPGYDVVLSAKDLIDEGHYHPERHLADQGLERYEIIQRVLRRLTNPAEETADNATNGKFIIVGTKGGYLRRVKKGITLKQLGKVIHTNLLEDVDGVPLVDGVIINGTLFEGGEYKEKLDKRIEHAAYIEFRKALPLEPSARLTTVAVNANP